MKMRRPLTVHVFWDDAADSNETCDWDGTFETAQKVPTFVRPYTNREAVGFLGYLDSEWLYLASDWDEPTSQLSKWAVIPCGWITMVKTGSGRIIYTKEIPNGKTMGRRTHGRATSARSKRRDQADGSGALSEV